MAEESYEPPDPLEANFTLESYESPDALESNVTFPYDIEVWVDREVTLTTGPVTFDNDRDPDQQRDPTVATGPTTISGESLQRRTTGLKTGTVSVSHSRDFDITRSAEWSTSRVWTDADGDHARDADLSINSVSQDALGQHLRSTELRTDPVLFDSGRVVTSERTISYHSQPIRLNAHLWNHRNPTIATGPIAVGPDREADYEREPTTSTSTIAIGPIAMQLATATIMGRPLTVASTGYDYREPTIATATISISADRTVDLNRDSTVFTRMTSVDPEGYGYRTPTLKTGRLAQAVGRTIDSSRSADLFVEGPFAVSNSREAEQYRAPGIAVSPLGISTAVFEVRDPTIGVAPLAITNTWWPIGGWAINDQLIHPHDNVELTPKILSLTFEADRGDLEHWRQYDRTGSVQVEVGFGGLFQTVDRAGRDGPTVLKPPIGQTPPFDKAEFYIDSYDESQLAPDLFEIDLEFHRTENRAGVFDALNEAGEPWIFELSQGTIALEERAVGQIDHSGSSSGATVTLPLLVTDQQAATLIDVAGYPDGVVDREVPEGIDFATDTTGGQQTVMINSPDGAAIGGEWLIRDWSMAMHNRDEERWLVELELAES